MTKQQKEEFLSFLKTKDPKETLATNAFGLLCLSYDENRKRKHWISFNQPENAPVFETIITVGDNTWHFSTLIGDIIKELE